MDGNPTPHSLSAGPIKIEDSARYSKIGSLWCIRCFGESDGKTRKYADFTYKGHSLCEDCVRAISILHSRNGFEYDYTIGHSKLVENPSVVEQKAGDN